MNKMFLTVAFIAMVFVQTSFTKDSTPVQQSPLPTAYFSLKDVLVAGSSIAAADLADSFTRILSVTASGIRPENVSASLLKDAQAISATKNLKIQREEFASLSSNMMTLVNTSRLSPKEVYHRYCPMKEASRLSNSKAIKYLCYGSAMLTCGNVKNLIKN